MAKKKLNNLMDAMASMPMKGKGAPTKGKPMPTAKNKAAKKPTTKCKTGKC